MIQGTDKIIDLTNTRDAWARYLNTFAWEWFATLTFSIRTSTRIAFKQFNRWRVMVQQAAGNKIYYFLVIEKPKFKGDNVHFHIFLNGVKGQNPDTWKQRWLELSGVSDIKPYDNTQGASYYISNKIVFKEENILFSKDLNEMAPVPVNAT